MNLYKHQEEALKQTEGFNKCAYYLDMGLGKTFTGSEKMMQLGMCNHPNLVICQKSKIVDWYNHFVEHYRYVAPVLDLTVPKELEQFLQSPTGCVGIINYELAFRRPELLKLQNFTLMLDESSLIQNRKAKQTKFILKLKPANVILLSGTPCSGKYENLWTQAILLGWDISEDLYMKQYVNRSLVDFGGVKHWEIDKENPYKNIERLKSKLRSYGAVFTKTEEVFDLPSQNFIDVNVPASKEYKKFKKDSIITINDKELVGDTSLTKLLYSRQLCSIYSEEKLEAFVDLVESTQDRLIVFYNFNDELDKMLQYIRKPCSIINGQIKELHNYERYDNSITFVQYQAGAMGLNLQKANKIIYYSPTLRCEHWMQSQKRIHRIGQEQPCFYYKMIVKGSVEEKIYQALERGVSYTDKLFEEQESCKM